MVGDPATEEGKTKIQQASPLFSASRIEKPHLIIQGANDPRVNQAEVDQIVIALRDRGHDVNYLLVEVEGHGFAKPVNRMAMYPEGEIFCAGKLGIRFQPEMPNVVAQRLNQLRVDVAKVKYGNPKNVQIAVELPAVAPNLKEGVEKWEVKISIQGQELPMRME
jgi:hypothetical protein